MTRLNEQELNELADFIGSIFKCVSAREIAACWHEAVIQGDIATRPSMEACNSMRRWIDSQQAQHQADSGKALLARNLTVMS